MQVDTTNTLSHHRTPSNRKRSTILFSSFVFLDFPSFSSLQTWVCSPTPPSGLAVSLKCAAVVVIVAPPRFALDGNLITLAAGGLSSVFSVCLHADNKLVNPQPLRTRRAAQCAASFAARLCHRLTSACDVFCSVFRPAPLESWWLLKRLRSQLRRHTS